MSDRDTWIRSENTTTGPDNYTWWHLMSGARKRNVGWRIDYFYVTEDLMPSVSNAWILPDVMGSDHCPIGIEVAVWG